MSLHTASPPTRPVRYRHDRFLSSIVDQIQATEDQLIERGDLPNARRAASARSAIATIAIGIQR